MGIERIIKKHDKDIQEIRLKGDQLKDELTKQLKEITTEHIKNLINNHKF